MELIGGNIISRGERHRALGVLAASEIPRSLIILDMFCILSVKMTYLL